MEKEVRIEVIGERVEAAIGILQTILAASRAGGPVSMAQFVALQQKIESLRGHCVQLNQEGRR